jgi:type VI protein secretion system component VasK
MKKAKRFDCVQMKNDIQAGMRHKYRGMTDAEIQADIEQQLATSDSPVAKLWRQVARETEPAKVAEAPAKYITRRGSRRQHINHH